MEAQSCHCPALCTLSPPRSQAPLSAPAQAKSCTSEPSLGCLTLQPAWPHGGFSPNPPNPGQRSSSQRKWIPSSPLCEPNPHSSATPALLLPLTHTHVVFLIAMAAVFSGTSRLWFMPCTLSHLPGLPQLSSGQTPVPDGRVSRHRQAWGIFLNSQMGPSSDLPPRLHVRKRF